MSTYAELIAQAEALQAQATEILVAEKASVLENIRAQVLAYEITAADIFPPRPSRQKVAAKYRLGDKKWSGRGKRPAWVVDHLSAGGTMEQVAV